MSRDVVPLALMLLWRFRKAETRERYDVGVAITTAVVMACKCEFAALIYPASCLPFTVLFLPRPQACNFFSSHYIR